MEGVPDEKEMKNLLVILAILLGLFGSVTAQSDAPNTQVGNILVVSIPRSLKLSADGEERGSTPVLLKDLTAGSHILKLSHPLKDNWPARDWQKTVVIHPGVTDTLQVNLTSVLSVSSYPFGASVILDGKEIGKTPFFWPELEEGHHEIQIYSPKRQVYSDVIQIDSLQFKKIDITLPPINKSELADTDKIGKDKKQNRSPSDRLFDISPRRGRITTYSFLGLSMTSALGAYMVKNKANSFYNKYLHSADPVNMDTFYNKTIKYDRIAGALWGVFEISFVLTFYFSLF